MLKIIILIFSVLLESILMIIKNVVVGPLEVNCYIIGCEDTKEAVIIDPGDNDSFFRVFAPDYIAIYF